LHGNNVHDVIIAHISNLKTSQVSTHPTSKSALV